MTAGESHKAGRRLRKRERTKNHLAATAFRLFEAHGYEAVAMEQIAAQADVAKGTLYNHFPVKEALLAHQFRAEIAAGMAGLQGALDQQRDFRSRMQALLKASARWNASRRAYLPHYLRYRTTEVGVTQASSDSDHHSGVHRILETMFAAAQEKGEVRSDLAPAELAWLFEFMCMGAVMVWLGRPGDSLEHRFLLGLDVLLDGIAVPEAFAETDAAK